MIYGLLVQPGFRKYMIGHGVYVQETKSRINLICLYVDDLLVIEATSLRKYTHEVITRFKMEQCRPTTKYIKASLKLDKVGKEKR